MMLGHKGIQMEHRRYKARTVCFGLCCCHCYEPVIHAIALRAVSSSNRPRVHTEAGSIYRYAGQANNITNLSQ